MPLYTLGYIKIRTLLLSSGERGGKNTVGRHQHDRPRFEMFEATILVLLCSLTANSQVFGDPMIQMKMCDNKLEEVITHVIKLNERYMLRGEIIGSFLSQETRGHGNSGERRRGDKVRTLLQAINVSFSKIKVRVLPRKSMEVSFQSSIVAESTSNKPRVHFTVVTETSAIIQLRKEDRNLSFTVEKCDVFIIDVKYNRFQISGQINVVKGKHEGPLKLRFCNEIKDVVEILNMYVSEMPSIDRTGVRKLVCDTIGNADLDCLEISLKLVSRGKEIKSTSGQSHSYVPGNSISVLKDYINEMLSTELPLEYLNRIIESMNLHLQPNDTRSLIPGADYSGTINLKITFKGPLQMTQDSDNAMLAISAQVQGFNSYSADLIFTGDIDLLLSVDLSIDANKLLFAGLFTRSVKIQSWSSSVGNSRDMDFKNLEDFMKAYINDKILPTINLLQIFIVFPNFKLDHIAMSRVIVKQDSVEMLPRLRGLQSS
ncbi:uncharacterized protein LOC142466626 [Ascaphus truei]|uniref:uncharacterized protein LOC142466626 n=1 Tax=Ascaphus truei TaxID=8439 RepID=UPI003F591236